MKKAVEKRYIHPVHHTHYRYTGEFWLGAPSSSKARPFQPQISTADRTHARTGPDTQRAQAHNHTQNSNPRTHHFQTNLTFTPHTHTHLRPPDRRTMPISTVSWCLLGNRNLRLTVVSHRAPTTEEGRNGGAAEPSCEPEAGPGRVRQAPFIKKIYAGCEPPRVPVRRATSPRPSKPGILIFRAETAHRRTDGCESCLVSVQQPN